MPELTLLSAAVLIASLALSLGLNWYFIRHGRRDDDADMARRIHVRPIGRQGGIAVFLTLAAVVGSGSVAAFVVPRFFPAHVRDALEARVQRRFEEESRGGEISNLKSEISTKSQISNQKSQKPSESSTLPPVPSSYALIVLAVSGARKVAPQVLVLFGAGTVIFLLGLLDDRRGVRWRWKLLVQLGAAVAMTLAGYRISAFSFVPGANTVVSILWIVGITNAFNFIDGMDGLCAGVAAIAAGVLAYFMAAYDHALVLLFLMALLGALLGFLRFNFRPARIFMGDGGSTFVGFMLAAITLQASYTTIETKTVLPVLIPVLVLAVPLYDISSVILIRLWNRRSPFQADTNHLHHRLKRAGMSDRQAVLFIWVMAFAMGVNSTLLSQVDELGGGVILVQAVAVMGLFVILERVMRQEANALHAGRTDPLFSVKARFTVVSTQGKPRSLAECAEMSGVAREFDEGGFWLLPETAMTCQDLADHFEGRKAFKVDLVLNGSAGEPEMTTVCRLENVEQKPGRNQRLRLAIEKMSGKSRSRYQEFLEEKVEKAEQAGNSPI